MYRKVMMQSYMMQSYLSEDVCQKFYVKVVLNVCIKIVCIAKVMLKNYFSKSCYERIIGTSCMYRKVMMQSYLSENVCKKFYVKVVFRNYNFPKKLKYFQKRKQTCCLKSRARSPS